MAIKHIEHTLADAITSMTDTYGIDEYTSLSILEYAIGKSYNSDFPAAIWEDGTISIITDEGQKHFQLSNMKLGQIKKIVTDEVAKYVNLNNVSIFTNISSINSSIFYMHIEKVNGRHVEGKVFRYLDKKEDNVLLNGIHATLRVSSKTIFPKDKERDIFKVGNNILVSFDHLKENDDGTITASFTRNSKKLITYVINSSFSKLNVLNIEYKYSHWFNNQTNTISILERDCTVSKEHRLYIFSKIRKKINTNVRFIDKKENNED
ncbi:MAG: hypothetical protein COB67_00150 [SAR324 cluster bacterium]|uniref:Uncharacterized protein n=1 Tax=SAR324 cluster bacterium TaxID=2024889 RepID=A0A2A4TBB3_9DELT|nr:MAG: hypothetical protein COB67_00150 [SAR324 cluster bacterium]